MLSSGSGWPSCTTRWKNRPSRSPAGSVWRSRLDPDRASAHLSLGWAFQDESRFDEAREHYDAAIQLQPDFAAAFLNLGGLQEELGDLAAAEQAFRTALEKQPTFALPHARLATLLRSKLPDGDLAALEERLKDDKLPESPRARLLFAFAHALDGKGEFEARCRMLSRAESNFCADARDQSHPSRLRSCRARESRRRPAQLLRSRVIRTPCALPAPSQEDRCSSSGCRALGHDPDRAGAGQPFASLRRGRAAAGSSRSFEGIPPEGVLGRSGPARDSVTFLDRTAVLRLAETHLERLAAIDNGASSRIVDKMPDNYMYIGMLSTMFPRATFIHCKAAIPRATSPSLAG